jgi:hypothetical protein
MLSAADRNIRAPLLYRIVSADGGKKWAMADVPKRVNMQGVHYVLREIAPGSLSSYVHLTTGYNLYHEEDRDGAESLSANYIQQLARSNSVLVTTYIIPETASRRLNVNSLGTQATYPALPQVGSSYSPLSTGSEDQTMRAPKRGKDLVSETSTDKLRPRAKSSL